MSAYLLELPGGDPIPYQLKLRPRRTVGMRIGADGLTVHAPKRISQSELNRILLDKAGWIRSKLEARHELATPPTEWRDGTSLMLLGNDITLRVSHDARSRNVEFQAGILSVALPNVDDQTSIARKVIKWYRKEAQTDFGRRLELLSAKLGIATPKLFLSNAGARWGSCNSKKEVRLNWRLIQAPPHIINYVAAHELAHIKEMNHSAKFWAVVESLIVDYKKAEKELKTMSSLLHAIDQ